MWSALKNSSSHAQKICSTGWVGSVFLSFFHYNVLDLLQVHLMGSRGLMWGFGAGWGSLFGGGWLVGVICSGDGSQGLFSGRVCLAGSALSLVFCPGRWPCLVLGPWIGFGGPGDRLGASLRISLML